MTDRRFYVISTNFLEMPAKVRAMTSWTHFELHRVPFAFSPVLDEDVAESIIHELAQHGQDYESTPIHTPEVTP